MQAEKGEGGSALGQAGEGEHSLGEDEHSLGEGEHSLGESEPSEVRVGEYSQGADVECRCANASWYGPSPAVRVAAYPSGTDVVRVVVYTPWY